ncbi:MAG: hypothetical protein QXT37_08490 [Thermofilaceae archaeon]
MADAVTTPGIALAMYARSVRGGAGSSQVYIVPNGISEHFLKQYDGRYVREKLGYSEGDLVVGYVGSIEFWLDMKPLIEAVSEARKKGCGIRFMLIGGHLQTAYAEKVARWIEQEGIGNITDRLGFIHHEEVPRYIASMDIGAIPFDVKNPTAYYAAPNKLTLRRKEPHSLLRGTKQAVGIPLARSKRRFYPNTRGTSLQRTSEYSKKQKGLRI